MTYLLDTNTLIQAKNEYYGFHLCPGFWSWIEEKNKVSEVVSIEPVLSELREGDDDLTAWANEHANDLFLPIDQATLEAMPRIVEWVDNMNFKQAAKVDFLAKADPLLIAYAMSHENITLVSHEVHIEGERKKVKIPTVCREFGVRCIRTFSMLSQEQARFVLES